MAEAAGHVEAGGSESPGDNEPEPGGSHAAPGIHITLILETDDLDPPLAGWLVEQLQRVAQRAGVQRAELTCVAVDDAQMSQLHEQYKNVPGTTDVLSFDMSERDLDDVAPQQIEGDIVICLDEAARQAQRRDLPARVEALLYAVHGMLHLLGYDDADDDNAARMHAREDELLKAIGIGAVYER